MKQDIDIATIEKNIIRSFGLVKQEITELQAKLEEMQKKVSNVSRDNGLIKRNMTSMRARMTAVNNKLTAMTKSKRK